MNILGHVFLLASCGMLGGWLLVEGSLATRPLVAGGVVTTALVILYFLLRSVHWILNYFVLRSNEPASRTAFYKWEDRFAARAFDSRGRLRVHRSRNNLR